AAASKGLKIKIESAPLTTQIEPHDAVAELFDGLRRTNTILVGLCQDIWRYISDGLIVQRAVAGEVGSSTMPQKVNPIHFENAEGNLGAAGALCGFFSAKLPVSRLQRDLSDSTVERNYGAAFAHSLIAYRSIMDGFSRISVNRAAAARSLADHPEVYAEAIQTVLRRESVEDPYSLLKDFTRGRGVTVPELHAFVDGLPVKPAVKAELKALLSKPYTGLASRLAARK
ncbi:MAG: lyase family protein, partial [Elusimicrobiales bacterium]|nr:lyase family protein [Elusimicrobiales bacterium]